MPRNLNVNFSNWRTTGVNVTVPQRSLDVTISFTDEAGNPHNLTQTILFPNVLAQLPASYLDAELKEAIVRWHRVAQGIDQPDSLRGATMFQKMKERLSMRAVIQRYGWIDVGISIAIWAIAKHFGIF